MAFAIPYAVVVWTSGDLITETKLDNMVANDQAYDSHAAEGIELDEQGTPGNPAGDTIRVYAKDRGSVSHLFYKRDDGTEVQADGVNDWITAGDGATVTFDLAKGRLHDVTLGGNRTLAVSNNVSGYPFVVKLIQDGTGSRTVSWWAGITWAGGSAPTLMTTGGKADVFGFIATGAATYDGFVVGQNL